MTVAFTSLVAIFVIERVSEKGGAVLLFPAVVVGAASVAYWRYARLLRMAFSFLSRILGSRFLFLDLLPASQCVFFGHCCRLCHIHVFLKCCSAGRKLFSSLLQVEGY